MRIWSLKATTKQNPSTHKKGGCTSHNSNFKIMSFQELYRMCVGGFSYEPIAVQLFPIKAPLDSLWASFQQQIL